MSVLDKIAELEQQKQQLMAQAKTEALKKAEAAIAELNSLGFNYKLSGGPVTRRTGIRQEVLNIIKSNPNGVARAGIIDKLDANDKSAQQSVSNALSALKKSGTVDSVDGVYKAV